MSMSEIQAKLKAPKGQFNSFGKYKYRSCEDIVESVKPILAEYGYHLLLSDDARLVGDRVYIEATCRVMSGADVVSETKALAREPEDKKGMDASQITGTASSYARKYALNGLFAIDDTKDADTEEHHNQTKKPAAQADKVISEKFEACADIDQLKTLWESLNNDQRNAHAADKNAAKARLS